jgi:stage V sporulation protein G
MQITEVNVTPINNEKKLKGFASIVFDNCFIVSDIKIIETARGAFLSMPSKKAANGKFRDVAHPLNGETRKMIEERVFETYETVTGHQLGTDFAVEVEAEALPDTQELGPVENKPEPKLEAEPVLESALDLEPDKDLEPEEKADKESADTSTLLSVKEFGY